MALARPPLFRIQVFFPIPMCIHREGSRQLSLPGFPEWQGNTGGCSRCSLGCISLSIFNQPLNVATVAEKSPEAPSSPGGELRAAPLAGRAVEGTGAGCGTVRRAPVASRRRHRGELRLRPPLPASPSVPPRAVALLSLFPGGEMPNLRTLSS